MGRSVIGQRLSAFLACERGITSIEYSFIAATLAVILIPAMDLLSADIKVYYDAVIKVFQSVKL